MADPLSIASGIAGLIPLAEQVFFRICRYIKAVRGAKEEVLTLSTGLRDLLGVLNQLRLWAAQKEAEDPDHKLSSSSRLPLIESCYRLLLRLSRKLEKVDPSKTSEPLPRQLKWPFSSSEMRRLVEDLGHLKTSITMALSFDSLAAMAEVLSTQHMIVDDIRGIKEGLEKQRIFEQNFINLISKKEREEVIGYFEKASLADRHQMSKALRHSNTGMWLVESDEFQDWLAGKYNLWLSGIPGAGKTVLASAVIGATEAYCQGSDMAYAYFYCDYKDESTQNLANIICSLLAQLAVQSVDAFRLLQKCHNSSRSSTMLSRTPELKTLLDVFKDISACFGAVYVVVDGVDECGSNGPSVARELSKIASMPVSGNNHVMVALLSRAEEDIKCSLNSEFAHIEIAARSGDIQLFVSEEMDRRIRTGDLEIINPGLKEVILRRLVEGAEGM